MKISQLPEDVNIKALENQKESKGRLVWDKKTDNLDQAFDWEDSEEGHDYWRYWYDKEFIQVTWRGKTTSNTFVGPSAKKTIVEDQAWKVTTTDTIVLSVIEDLNSRSILGIEKYKTTLDREDLSRKDWLQHAYEECLDQANYLKKLISLEK
jgi:hypothetical protein